MGDEHGRANNELLLVDDPAKAIIAISARLGKSIRRSLRNTEETAAPVVSLESDHDENIYCLVYLAAHSPLPVAKSAMKSLRELVNMTVESNNFDWDDRLGPQISLELAKGNAGLGMQDLYANLNHHNAGARAYVIDLTWLARSRLDPHLAAERILFNVGASHGSAAKGLAALWAMCADETLFWSCVQDARPDFADSSKYGWGLDTPWPERREANLTKELDALRNPASEIARYVKDPHDLWELERRAAETARAAVDAVAAQLKLLL